MKHINLLLFALGILFTTSVVKAQCRHTIKIDGNITEVDEGPNGGGLKLPVWLKATQTLAVDQNVNSISVIEFTVNGTSLDFSAVLNVTTIQTVPAAKVWKIESILNKVSLPSASNSITYTDAGTFSTVFPACVTYVCIEVWGAGGGGGGICTANNGAAGGGGGGYGQGCFTVTSGTPYTVTVGRGGAGNSNASGSAGGTSSVGVLISATGGGGGGSPVTTCGGSGTAGAGGTCGAAINATGTAGTTGGNGNPGGAGGAAGNGGAGGATQNTPDAAGNDGISPGGGGGGGRGLTPGGVSRAGGTGGTGKVIITW